MNTLSLPAPTLPVKPQTRTETTNSRLVTDRDGLLWKRSTLMTQARAQSFCKCMAANPHVTDAETHFSRQAKGDVAWYVQWIPKSAHVRDVMFDTMQGSRLRTAEREISLGLVAVYPLANKPGLYTTVNQDGHGKPHIVDLQHNECDCEDFVYRCMTVGLRCHHLCAVQLHVDALAAKPVSSSMPQAICMACGGDGIACLCEKPTSALPVETSAERRARLKVSADRDF